MILRIFSLLLFSPVVFAAGETSQIAQDYRETEKTEINISNVHVSATGPEYWNLTDEEWTRYKQLMQGPQGRWTPNEDPTFVLGLQARTVEERKRMARLQVEIEKKRTEQGLAFALAYSEAWYELYPNLPVVDSLKAERHKQRIKSLQTNSNSFNTLQQKNISKPIDDLLDSVAGKNDRYVVFVDQSCNDCNLRVPELIRRTRSIKGAGVDIYFVNMTQDEIIAWASSINIPQSLVNGSERKVTLTQGDKGLLNQLAIAHKQEPTTYYLRSGKSYKPLAF